MSGAEKLKNGIFVKELVWIGDGFNSAMDQVGKKIVVSGSPGVVTSATHLTITVTLDGWHPLRQLLNKIWFCARSAFGPDGEDWTCRRPWFHSGDHRDRSGGRW